MLLHSIISTVVGYDTGSVLTVHQWNLKGDISEETDFLTLIILQEIDNAGHIRQMRKELTRLQRFYVLCLIKAEHLHEDSFHLFAEYTRRYFFN